MKPPVVIGDAILYRADCKDILQSLSFDGIASDPPYGIDHRRGSSRSREQGHHKGPSHTLGHKGMVGDDKAFDPRHLLSWPCVLWGANHYAHRLPLHPKTGSIDGSWLVWDKVEHGGAGDFSKGEIGWCSHRGALDMFHHMWMGIQRASQQAEKRRHKTEKPIALMEWSIGKLRLSPGATICDPYMGSGTTGVAALRMGYRFIGMEIDEGIFGIACKRLEDAQRQGDLLQKRAA
jgi:site-specific DNA-methyltransferase (adenine-specific)/modification methylase